ncbi:MAG: T9SS type A sorting domain-containing protein [Bacteroidia bacterium]|nr:T9SS type A sorting domain-containing protein [Bacteroidia bacterium]
MRKTKTKKWLTALFAAGSLWASAQCTPCSTVNVCEYVCNGSFENLISPPTAQNQVSLACGWNNTNPSTTPDLLSTAGGVDVDIPCNVGGNLPSANTGSNCTHFIARNFGQSNWWEGIGTVLTTSLQAGLTYEITFYLALSSKSNYNSDNVGVYLQKSSFPQYQSSNYYVTTTSQGLNWTKYSILYTAYGGEDVLFIGAISLPYYYTAAPFSPYDCSGPISYSPGQKHSAYYLDDVSIREYNQIEVAATSTTGCTGESFTLTATGANTYTWNPGAMTGSNVVVSPSSATVYTVTGSTPIGCSVYSQTIGIYPASCCTNGNSGNISLKNATVVATGGIGWNTMTSGNVYTGLINAPTNSVVTNTLTIIGGLTINTPLTFSLCNVSVNEDVHIVQNSKTNIDRSWFYGCGKLWGGIISKAELNITNSFIEDAYIGVNIGYFSFIGSHPKFTSHNVVYDKNYISIIAGMCSMNTGSFTITGSIFTSRTISAALHNFAVGTQYNSTLLPLSSKVPAKLLGSTAYSITANTIRSNIGIAFYGLVSTSTLTPDFKVGGVSTVSQSDNDKYSNMFDYINEGVYNANSKILLINGKYSNIINTGVGNTLGAVYHNDGSASPSTTSTKVGQLGGGSSPTSYYKNIFGFGTTTTILDAVVAENGGVVDVSYNDFKTISRYGVAIKNWNATSVNTETVVVSNNSYTTAAYAFYGYNNQSISASVKSNTLVQSPATYTNNSNIYIDEINKPANASYTVNANNFAGTLNGVFARNAKNIRVINNTIQIAKPVTTSTYNAAVWFDNVENSLVKGNAITCNPTNSASWNTFGTFANASIQNTYKCNTISKVSACMKFQAYCYPTFNYKNTLNQTGGTDACLYGVWQDNSAQTGDIGGWNGSSYEMADIIWGDFSGADTRCQAGSNWNPTQYVTFYDAIKNAADYTPQVNTVPGGLDFSLPMVPVNTSATLTDYTCWETSRLASQGVKGTKNSNSPNEDLVQFEKYVKKQVLLPEISNVTGKVIKGANENNFRLVDSLIEQYISTKNQAVLNQAKSVNSSISTANNQELNLKNYNAIYCVFVEDDSLVTANQINDLHSLAQLCPFTDGLAVYEARGLVRNWNDSTNYYNSCENNIPEEFNNFSRFANSINDSQSAIQTMVYPNPSNGNLTVTVSLKDCIFEVYDVIGKKVMSQKLNENETKVDVSSLNNGTYLYKITQNNVVIKADKLVLSK